jgi:nucleotide-binding universal stress UspA family protein
MSTTDDITAASRGRSENARFTRIVVGLDGSAESVEAARQAQQVAAPGAELELLASYSVAAPIVGANVGSVPLSFDAESQREAATLSAGAAAKALGGDPVQTIARGPAKDVLLEAAGSDRRTLLAVGSHGVGRLRGIFLGSTATEVIHMAQGSVLVARSAGAGFPTRIVVGVDGSPESAAAFTVAHELAQRHGAKLWPAIAYGGDHVDKDAARAIAGEDHDELPDEPATALVAAAADADLLVVGSRGLHGLKALGSVSERVAHNARCSVLIVRNATR